VRECKSKVQREKERKMERERFIKREIEEEKYGEIERCINRVRDI
jgi:hypothetical protein